MHSGRSVPVARTNQQLIINAGYIYDTSILQKMGRLYHDRRIHEVDAAYFGDILEDVDIEIQDSLSRAKAGCYAICIGRS